jgi:hypothetical protein
MTSVALFRPACLGNGALCAELSVGVVLGLWWLRLQLPGLHEGGVRLVWAPESRLSSGSCRPDLSASGAVVACGGLSEARARSSGCAGAVAARGT